MTTNELQKAVNESILTDSKVKVYFKDFTRSPVFGNCVSLADAKELENKKMFRFVSESSVDLWLQVKRTELTRVMTLDTITQIKIVW